MIYYPDENASTPSWAGPALGVLGYNRDPSKLQLMIRRAFVEATSYVYCVVLLFSPFGFETIIYISNVFSSCLFSFFCYNNDTAITCDDHRRPTTFFFLFFFQRTIRIPGSQVIPVPLFNALDGKNSRDYIARVEPSSRGGKKMAEYILDMIENDGTSVTGGGSGSGVYGSLSPTPASAPVEPSYMAGR